MNKDTLLAFHIWRGTGLKWKIDQAFEPVLNYRTPPQDWVRMARLGRELSTHQMAEKLGVSPSAYSQLERRATERKLTLDKFDVIAEALDCEVVFALRPKSGRLD